MASMPQFRARPVSHRVLESCGDQGVPKVAPKPLTEPQEFSFQVGPRSDHPKNPEAVTEILLRFSIRFQLGSEVHDR